MDYRYVLTSLFVIHSSQFDLTFLQLFWMYDIVFDVKVDEETRMGNVTIYERMEEDDELEMIDDDTAMEGNETTSAAVMKAGRLRG